MILEIIIIALKKIDSLVSDGNYTDNETSITYLLVRHYRDIP